MLLKRLQKSLSVLICSDHERFCVLNQKSQRPPLLEIYLETVHGGVIALMLFSLARVGSASASPTVECEGLTWKSGGHKISGLVSLKIAIFALTAALVTSSHVCLASCCLSLF